MLSLKNLKKHIWLTTTTFSIGNATVLKSSIKVTATHEHKTVNAKNYKLTVFGIRG